MQHVRVDHDPQRQLLQVHQLRDDERLRLIPCGYAREADLRVGLFYFYWLFIDRSQQLDPTLRRHHEENDAADQDERADDGRNWKHLVLLGLRLDRTDVDDGLLLSPTEPAEEQRNQPDHDQQAADDVPNSHAEVFCNRRADQLTPDARASRDRGNRTRVFARDCVIDEISDSQHD